MTAHLEDGPPAETSAQTPGNHFLLIAKVKPGQAETIRELAAQAPEFMAQPGSPLAQVGTVHFARVALLDDETFLFESHFDGPVEAYLDDFFTVSDGGETFDLLFRYCEGWPGPHDREGFIDFWTSHRVKDLITYSYYPGVTCKEIVKAVRIRRNMEAVLEDFQ